MQPDAPRNAIRPVFPSSTLPHEGLPPRVRIGLALALAGFIMARLPTLLGLYLLRFMTIVAYVQVTTALTATGFLLLGIGLFVVLQDLQRRLPGARPWISIGCVAVLVGGLFAAAIGLALLALAPGIYNFVLPPTVPYILTEALSDALWLGETSLGVGVLLALLGVVRGLIVRSVHANVPQSP